jgi:phosphoribosylglycinamide formyltransferase-1
MTQPPSELRLATAASPIRCAILISGSGSGMEAMVRHQQAYPECAHTTVLVLSDRPGAQGLQRALNLGIEATCVPLPTKGTDSNGRRHEHEKAIHQQLEAAGIELVILSGYMRLLSPFLVGHWAPNLLNIHPSLLPAFPGAHAHKDVLKSGAVVSGCTVHYVDEGMDSGHILAQRRVPVFLDDTEASLANRVRVEEHILYPKAVDDFVLSG